MELSVLLGVPVVITGLLSLLYAILRFNHRTKEKYTSKDWNYPLKKFWAQRVIQKWKESLGCSRYDWEVDCPHQIHDETCDNLTFYGRNQEGTSLYISFTRHAHRISNLIVIFTLKDGTVYQLPNVPVTEHVTGSGNSWTAGGLTLSVVDAFRKWRIVFNGLMTTTTKDGREELRHIRFNVLWVFAATPFKYPLDHSDSLLAEAVATKPWRNPQWMNEITHSQTKGYDQYGSFIGFYLLENETKPHTLGLYGLRRRRWRRDLPSLQSAFSLVGAASDGTVYNIEVEFTKTATQLKYGNIRTPNGNVSPIDSIKMDTRIFTKNSSPPNAFTIRVTAQDRNFIIFVTLNKTATMKYCGVMPEPWKCLMIPYQMGVNAHQGSGYLNIWFPYAPSKEHHNDSQPLYKHLSWLNVDKDDTIPICSTFKEKISCCPSVVGGKAASLSILSSVTPHEFTVPNGFCLTTRALEIQLKHHPELMKAIEDIENAGSNYNENIMKECCTKATKLFEITPVHNIIVDLISSYYEDLCRIEKETSNVEKLFVAVRSSGIGEDSEDLSAAGQNATILGCKSLAEVLIGVQKCWASLFTFQSVEYRRQYGQVVNCGMGVVIQVMVESEAAGVMFTKHPNNGNPRELLITSSYGLGESVVSGHVDPDTIIIDVTGNQLKIKSYEVGKKNQKIVLDHSGSQQTLSLELDEDGGKSLSDEQCLSLARIGLEQEILWGSPRDIEWAVVRNRIYLLQARPITCLNNWTEFELMHEMDTAVMSEHDLMTFANTGEVLQGSASPFSQSFLVEALDKSIAVHIDYNTAEYKPLSVMSVTHHHIGLNLMNSFVRYPDKKVDINTRVSDIAVCGHEVINDKILSIAIHRHGCNKLGKLRNIFRIVSYLWKNKEITKQCKEVSDNFNIDLSRCKTASEMLHTITSHLEEVYLVGKHHSSTTSASIFSQIVFLSTILGSATDFTSENYQDIGTILSSCNDVVSAEVPETLKEISKAINRSEKATEFGRQKPEEALDWLKVNIPGVHSTIVQFLKKHGHRCVGEFDVLTDPWVLDPTPLMTTLQMSYSIPPKESPPPMTIDQLIGKLVTPISASTKKFLKLVVPICQSSVTRRELTKAAYISVVHKMRLATRVLGEQMVKEWRIPDSKLLYMMTLQEIQRLLNSRDPGIIIKAKLRRRYKNKWANLQFPELNWGFPQPMESEDTIRVYESDMEIHGTPVCSGDVVGRACVIKDISRIGELQHGDILVTLGTDIGWSPYFPMLSGVVTELGGLISHGAVVAREYGLPCIVGAQGATSVFKTGDMLLLSGGSGVLKKIVKEQIQDASIHTNQS